MKYLIAVFISLVHSIRHVIDLEICRKEMIRYLKKSINLSLCYVDFLDSTKIRNAPRAGEAAFLCCAYDVVTDWRGFNEKQYFVFKKILLSIVNSEVAEIALSLYKKEKDELLCDDGLERGEVALKFITVLTGMEERFRERTDFAKLGRILQIGDDVLDYEDDLRNNELNCLASPRKWDYLKLVASEITDDGIKKLFPHGKIIKKVLFQVKKKAERMLKEKENKDSC